MKQPFKNSHQVLILTFVSCWIRRFTKLRSLLFSNISSSGVRFFSKLLVRYSAQDVCQCPPPDGYSCPCTFVLHREIKLIGIPLLSFPLQPLSPRPNTNPKTQIHTPFRPLTPVSIHDASSLSPHSPYASPAIRTSSSQIYTTITLPDHPPNPSSLRLRSLPVALSFQVLSQRRHLGQVRP